MKARQVEARRRAGVVSSTAAATAGGTRSVPETGGQGSPDSGGSARGSTSTADAAEAIVGGPSPDFTGEKTASSSTTHKAKKKDKKKDKAAPDAADSTEKPGLDYNLGWP